MIFVDACSESVSEQFAFRPEHKEHIRIPKGTVPSAIGLALVRTEYCYDCLNSIWATLWKYFSARKLSHLTLVPFVVKPANCRGVVILRMTTTGQYRTGTRCFGGLVRVGASGRDHCSFGLHLFVKDATQNCFKYICSRAAGRVLGPDGNKERVFLSLMGWDVRLMGKNMSQGWNEGQHYANLLVATMALPMVVETVRKQAFVVFPTLQQFLSSSCNSLFPLPVSTQVPIILLTMYLFSLPSKLSWQGSLLGMYLQKVYVASCNQCQLMVVTMADTLSEGWCHDWKDALETHAKVSTL